MELLLNLVWLVIAVGSVCVWRGVWRRGNAPSRREWVAFATFLFLIFPVISLTDDMHEELALAECATGTKHFLLSANRCASHQSARQASATHFAAIWNHGITAPVSEGARLKIHHSIALFFPALEKATGRAPPQFLS
jgi:hypothetical protein